MLKIALRYGLQMFVGFMLLFLVLHLVGLGDRYNLRMLNLFIHIAFIYLAVKKYRKEHPDMVMNSLAGAATGMVASAIGVTMFTVAMCIYLYINHDFFEQLRARAPMQEYFTPFYASLYLWMEGTVVGLLGAYICDRIIDVRQEGR